MPYDSNGNHSLPAGYLAVTGQTIQASQHNPPLEDLSSSLSQTLLRSGAAPMGGPLNMNGFRVINLPEASNDADPVTYAQLQALLSGLAVVPTGAVQGFDRTTAPSGWVKRNGGTIGNASSGGTARANADTEDLFTLLWGQFDNTKLPIQTSAGAASTRGASAAADFAANKRLPLFDSRSRFHRASDDGLGFDATLTVGSTQDDGIKNHKHPGTTSSDTHSHTIPRGSGSDNGAGAQSGAPTSGTSAVTNTDTHNHTFTTDDNTGGLSLETRPRSSVLLFCIKL